MSSSETRTTSSTRVADHGSVSAPGDLTPMPSAIVAWRLSRWPSWTAFHAAGKRSVCTPTICEVGAERLGRRRHAGDQAAAADGDDERVDRRLLRQHLERDRALAGDHREVVERMDDREAALGDELQAGDTRVLEGVAFQDDLGAEAARVLDLDARGEARHDDGRGDAHPLAW